MTSAQWLQLGIAFVLMIFAGLTAAAEAALSSFSKARRGSSNQRPCERWPLTIAGSRIGSVTLAAKMRPWKPLAF